MKFRYKGKVMDLQTHPSFEKQLRVPKDHVIIDYDVFHALEDILTQREATRREEEAYNEYRP